MISRSEGPNYPRLESGGSGPIGWDFWPFGPLPGR